MHEGPVGVLTLFGLPEAQLLQQAEDAVQSPEGAVGIDLDGFLTGVTVSLTVYGQHDLIHIRSGSIPETAMHKSGIFGLQEAFCP